MNIENNFQPYLKHDIAYYGDETSTFGKTTVACSCGHVVMEVYKDEQEGGTTVSYDLAFYYYRPEEKSPLKRLKTAWKYLWKGERILVEDLVLSQEEMDKLNSFKSPLNKLYDAFNKEFFGENRSLKNSLSDTSNTGYKGIILRERKGRATKYQVEVNVPRKESQIQQIYVGNYDTLLEAISEREEFIKSLL